MKKVTLKVTGGRGDKIVRLYDCGKEGESLYGRAKEILSEGGGAVKSFIEENFKAPDVETFIHSLDDSGCISVCVESESGEVVFQDDECGKTSQRGFVRSDPRRWRFDESMGVSLTARIRKYIESQDADFLIRLWIVKIAMPAALVAEIGQLKTRIPQLMVLLVKALGGSFCVGNHGELGSRPPGIYHALVRHGRQEPIDLVAKSLRMLNIVCLAQRCKQLVPCPFFLENVKNVLDHRIEQIVISRRHIANIYILAGKAVIDTVREPVCRFLDLTFRHRFAMFHQERVVQRRFPVHDTLFGTSQICLVLGLLHLGQYGAIRVS